MNVDHGELSCALDRFVKSGLYGYPWLDSNNYCEKVNIFGLLFLCPPLIGVAAIVSACMWIYTDVKRIWITLIIVAIVFIALVLIERTSDMLLKVYISKRLKDILKSNPTIAQDLFTLLPVLKAYNIPAWHYPSRMERVINWLENITAEAIDIESPALELYWAIEECSRGLKFIDSMLSRKDNTP